MEYHTQNLINYNDYEKNVRERTLSKLIPHPSPL